MIHNDELRNFIPKENLFKFSCKYCNSSRLHIIPIDYPYYESADNYNEFITHGDLPITYLEAVKKVNNLLCVCKECGETFVDTFSIDCIEYFNNWVKVNKIKSFDIINLNKKRSIE